MSLLKWINNFLLVTTEMREATGPVFTGYSVPVISFNEPTHSGVTPEVHSQGHYFFHSKQQQQQGEL